MVHRVGFTGVSPFLGFFGFRIAYTPSVPSVRQATCGERAGAIVGGGAVANPYDLGQAQVVRERVHVGARGQNTIIGGAGLGPALIHDQRRLQQRQACRKRFGLFGERHALARAFTRPHMRRTFLSISLQMCSLTCGVIGASRSACISMKRSSRS